VRARKNKNITKKDPPQQPHHGDATIASKLFGPGFKSQKSLIVFWLTDDGQKSLGK
jgi:hypothetical protein